MNRSGPDSDDRTDAAAAEAAYRAGCPAEAKRLCEVVLARDPDAAKALHLYGVLAFQAGEVEAALAIMAKAATRDAGNAVLHKDLGNMLFARGREAEALAAYQRAVALDPALFPAQRNLALLHRQRGELAPALARFCAALALAPQDDALLREFAVSLRDASITAPPPGFEPILLRCFARDDIDHQDIALAAIGLLEARAAFGELHGAARRGDAAWLEVPANRPALDGFVAEPLLLAMLGRACVVTRGMEQVLTWLRRLILLGPLRALASDPSACRFVAALGLQCHHNGFVFDLGADEAAAVAALAANVDARLAAGEAPAALEPELRVVALYRPLHGLAGADRLAATPIERWREPLRVLLARSVHEPRAEAALRAGIPSLAAVSDATSQAVMAQYEEDPYPSWLTLAATERTTLAAELRELFPGLALPAAFDGPVEALVAGCGTGRHPLELARRLATREIVAVDLSRASLAYALRMARKLGIEGVRFLQGDILSLETLGRDFDLVECTGALHHMADPLAGWRVLCRLLRPQGVMRIALYSERARKGVVAARERARVLGLQASPEDIRAFRRRILAGAEPALAEHVESSDFYSLSACRDLLFHACEHRFTPLGLAAALDNLGLEFLGLELPPAVARAYRERFPEDPAMTDLARWDRLEAERPDSFAGMFVFWCRKITDLPSPG
jgi:SAM-dependent methyltransferase